MIFLKPTARAAHVLAALGLGALLLAGTAAHAQSSTPARGALVRQTTLLVEDIDRTLSFYVRLGMTKASDQTIEETEGQPAIFAPGDLPLTADPKTSRLVVVKGANDQAGLGLLAYERPRLSSARTSLGALGTGDIIITIEVPDIAEAYKRLSQAGTKFQRLPYKATITGNDGSQQMVQRMLAFDPDGHLAEIIQTIGTK